MALWHFMNGDVPVSWDDAGEDVSSFDDGLAFNPDEDGFDRSKADAFAAKLGSGVRAEYTGTPNRSERVEREAQEAIEAEAAAAKTAAANAEIDALLRPIDPADAERVAINARFDALLVDAPDRSADIETLRKEAIDALD